MLGTEQIIIRLLISTVICGLIGLEREFKDKPAGLRTNILVGLGSTLVMILSLYFEADSARIAAGVVTGIGFVGAGLIIHGRNEVHGITTAATVWLVSAIGMTIGVGYYVPAIVTAIIALLVLHLFGDNSLRKIFKLD
ncbi:MAG: hypothetical protein A2731_03430 [Candidatus Buchananbacteria bacterium RIFCSPHIGHO2_01_FULL_39_8]|uniref:MgtC/SapB/SrpB/YhiD N-terminal domain-containing protein n=1 Tax=Candidatus Buchananbacteria bacterium RIFCSPHIGHO2_01_FULL_39_8 TaxID=1797533 RepID=A0A1G1XVY3_9BACT|nr:hypothetical protein [uncultured bacterium]OGY44243.1 MAG: hypothetical protein A2731_03430 [Candidatus Buchananbacteria bacterium RIFCSPHIGHO2_01_FULL_39_8]